MRQSTVEGIVGVFVLAGMASLAYLAISLGDLNLLSGKNYTVTALFESVSGLKGGSAVEMAGVEVGKVDRITLSPDDRARVTMRIRRSVKLTEDVIASVRTKGIIGDRYIKLEQGGADRVIPPGGRIRETTPPVDFEELIGQFIFGRVEKKNETSE
ncbi:MAG: outer membrane lipid asymmetry maintenance protein MlaD [Nitrospinota bacterium]